MAKRRAQSTKSPGRKKFVPETPQNLVLIVAHGVDGRALGATGHPASATPFLDDLAARGMLFPDAYCGTPTSRGALASLLRGTYVHQFDGWQQSRGGLDATSGFLGVLSSAGYDVAFWDAPDDGSDGSVRDDLAAWTCTAGIARPLYRMGPTSVIDEDHERVHGDDWARTDACGDWIESRTGSSPFAACLRLSLPAPGSSTSWHWLNRIGAPSIPIPPTQSVDHPFDEHMRRLKNWEGGSREDVVRLERRVHLAVLAEVDAMVGQVVGAIERAGRIDDTYIVVAAEHGEMALEHGQLGAGSLYEPSVRVPLIVAGPRVLAARQAPSPVSLVDVFPTVMDLARLPLPAELPGHSLMPACMTLVSKRPRWVFSEYHGATAPTGAYALRRGEWKVIAYGGLKPQLFNLREDPWETTNCAGSRRDLVLELGETLLGVCDPEAVEARVRDWGRAQFLRWRAEQLKSKCYREVMARVFSGWDGVTADGQAPWRDCDEAALDSWLNSGTGRG